MRAARQTKPVEDTQRMTEVLTVDEVAELLRIGRNEAYRAVKGGLIPSVHLGRSIRVPRIAFNRWLEEAGV